MTPEKCLERAREGKNALLFINKSTFGDHYRKKSLAIQISGIKNSAEMKIID
jgi:hypothetical protein